MDSSITIVAECGINHCGDIILAKEMIHQAKECGANVAKFQIYNPARLLDRNHPALKDYWDIILKTELTRKQVVELKEECDRVDIEFLASVFRPEVVEWTEAIGMKRYKIASRSIYDRPLADAILATGKPILMSYGYYEEGRAPYIALDIMKKKINGEVTPELIELYCVSKYPTPLSEIDFFDGGKSSLFQRDIFQGFSDHTIGITASIVAMSLGAKVIEKHVTFDRTFNGPDHFSSITFDELKTLCDMRDEIAEIL